MKNILLIFILLFSTNTIKNPKIIFSPPQEKNTLFYFIKDWINTPYRLGGTNKRGVDCSAFIRKLYEEVYDTYLPRTAYHQYKISRRIKKRDLEKGDLVFFKTMGKNPWHVGMYLGSGLFIHSSINFGVTVSSMGDMYYRSIYFAAGRII